MRGIALACCLIGGSLVCCLPGRATAGKAEDVPPAPAVTPVSCPGHPGAIGTSRTIIVNPATLPQIGTMQYASSLPLNDHEVVLTFDDGPVLPYTARILDILAANCVKATYFLVGRQAIAYPRLVRRIYNEGHSIGTHSQDHPLGFNRMSEPAILHQVDDGIASVEAAVGDPRAVAPFFRVPGLRRSKEVDHLLASQSLAVWSADEVADDWHHGITPHQIVRLAMKRIEAKGHRGVLLLHDIHPATAEALPLLLAELKAHGYHIVHAIPAGERPKSVPPLPATVIAAVHGEPRAIKASHVARAIKGLHRARHRRMAHAIRHHARSRRHARGGRVARRQRAQLFSALARKKHKTHTAAAGFRAAFGRHPHWR
jgi:peptidoglycan/xylan/chitin deacetylase (PgdA/CDA1 family)